MSFSYWNDRTLLTVNEISPIDKNVPIALSFFVLKALCEMDGELSRLMQIHTHG